MLSLYPLYFCPLVSLSPLFFLFLSPSHFLFTLSSLIPSFSLFLLCSLPLFSLPLYFSFFYLLSPTLCRSLFLSLCLSLCVSPSPLSLSLSHSLHPLYSRRVTNFLALGNQEKVERHLSKSINFLYRSGDMLRSVIRIDEKASSIMQKTLLF